MRYTKRFSWLVLGAAALCLGATGIPHGLSVLWPEEQRAFVQDGPGWLLPASRLEELLATDSVGRERLIASFLGDDPVPSTPENELVEGIERRRRLVRTELLTFLDDRARLLFLHGPPAARRVIDCAETFKPLEVWTYPGGAPGELLVFRPQPGVPYRLWSPLESKRALYNPEMEYWLEQWEALRQRGAIGGRRFDFQICEEVEEIDRITGVDGLFGFQPERPRHEEILAYLAPPADLATWAAEAAAAELSAQDEMPAGRLELQFPELAGRRMVTRLLVVLPPEAGVEPYVDEARSELRLNIEGLLERDGRIFDTFRVRYLLRPPLHEVPLALAVDRRLRSGQEFLARLRVTDEVSGRRLFLSRGFTVARTPEAVEVPSPSELVFALGDEMRRQRIAGADGLILVPPETDVVFGLWRAEALVTGERIRKVLFQLDGEDVMTRNRAPFTAELRLAEFPTEQLVRAAGYDESGELVASDEVVLNQPRGELRVRIIDPPRGTKATGTVTASVEVVVPEERSVETVTFTVNDEVQARVEQPPWEATFEVTGDEEITYLAVTAELDDGSRAEDVRFLNAPDYIDEVDVNLVELYTTVVDRAGRLVQGLSRDDFEVFENGRRQKIAKFELVDDLPLTIGIAIDTSGSMVESLGEARRAAIGFLESMITPRDRCFALAFADRPLLLMGRTSDVGAVSERLEDLVAVGSTSLHDAVVTALYYYRGVRHRRGLVLLSDGEDTSSSLRFDEALEYAKRSGVSIYAIGLRIGKTDIGVRRKLEKLAEETGGRTFYIKEATELAAVYGVIEKEFRSQYLVAYNSDIAGARGEYREVEVKIEGGHKARTIGGYYP